MKFFHEVRGCSLAVDIVARELGVPLELIWVDVPRKLLPEAAPTTTRSTRRGRCRRSSCPTATT